MAIKYTVLINDPTTHIATVRWQDGDNFRDEAFDLNLIYPGAAKMFSDMGLPFDYDAAYTYLQKLCQSMIDNGYVLVLPPNWPAGQLFQQTTDTTPAANIPQASA